MEVALGSHKSGDISKMDGWREVDTLGGNELRPPATRRAATRQIASNREIMISNDNKKRWSKPEAAIYQAPRLTRQQQACVIM